MIFEKIIGIYKCDRKLTLSKSRIWQNTGISTHCANAAKSPHLQSSFIISI